MLNFFSFIVTIENKGCHLGFWGPGSIPFSLAFSTFPLSLWRLAVSSRPAVPPVIQPAWQDGQAGGRQERIRKQRRAKRDAFDQGGFVTRHTLVFTVVSLTYSCSIVTEQEGQKKKKEKTSELSFLGCSTAHC